MAMMARNGEKADKDPFERVDACIRNLQDRNGYGCRITRSPATREAAMVGIVGELEEGHLPLEAIDLRCLTIFSLSGVSIKKGTTMEARLAYRAVGLLLLTLRDGSLGLLLDQAFPALSKAIYQTRDGGAPAALAAAAIDCLTVASFAGARHVEETMKAIWNVIVPSARSRSPKLKTRRSLETSPVLLAAAMSAWTFLLTTVVSATNTQQRNKADRSSNLSAMSLVEILDTAEDCRVRMAAGEALAVCVELNFLTGKDIDTLAVKVSNLAAESAGKRTDNSLLREQKELFGMIAAFLDHGKPPAVSWEWHDMMKVSTWVRLVQLNFMRKFLGKGFLDHVQGNPLLKEAFSFGRVEGKPLSIQKNESSMPIDGFLQDLKRNFVQSRDWAWVCYNIFCLDREDVYRCPKKLLQLGWQ